MDSPPTVDSRSPSVHRRDNRRARRTRRGHTSVTKDCIEQENRGGRSNEDPAPTREYLKWRRNADKLMARGQQEMVELLEASFLRRFPSRHTADDLKPHPKAAEEACPRSRRPNNPAP